jgi:predicted nucleotidyltransferase component of viral defense system
MTNFFNLENQQQVTLIEQTANKIGLPPQAIEKDLWVTTILQLVFSLPFADKLVFKGGTSLSKVWRVIERFSEDIDLAIARQQFGLEGDLTIKQIKKLRKQSSIFVKEDFYKSLQSAANQYGIQSLCAVSPEPDGEGDKTYPEPRKIFVRYKSLFDTLSYLPSEIVLEIGARSLIEPAAANAVKSLISESYNIDTSLVNPNIITAVPEKTFLEKAFLLHEIFTGKGDMTANRKSRHLYDLEKMMDKDFATKAISNDELWHAIHHHREVFTRVNGVDYAQDIRRNICLIPPPQAINDWRQDYEKMQNTLIYGASPSFDKLVKRMEELQERFCNL